jgi:uncharacterized cupredoxin-like copper-binding protein
MSLTRRIRSPRATAVLAVASTLVTAALLAGSHSAPAAAAPQSSTIQVRGGEFFFKLSTKSVARPGRVTFVFRNVGHVQHDFKINGKRTPLIGPGKTARLVVTFKKKGKYPYLCTVPGHAQAGMKGVFTVR